MSLKIGLIILLFFSRQDLGLQGSSLNDILYKNAAFLNLVDPISHELLLSLARDLQCPKRVRMIRFVCVCVFTLINRRHQRAESRRVCIY